MSFEINPVLAGTFDKPDYAAASSASNITAGADDSAGVDQRRYTQFDRSITDAGSTTDFTFSDLVDMFNPLEHIPIVSSVYRAITGDPINPVARVAGDIIYGGVIGGASAVLGGLGAVADVGLEAQTGKDSGGLVIAALFGTDDDKENPVRLADAGPGAASPTPAPAAAKPPAPRTIELAQSAAPAPMLAALNVQTNSEAPVTPQPANAPANPSAPAAAPVFAAAAAAAPAVVSAAAASAPVVPSPAPPGGNSAATTAGSAQQGAIPLLASAKSVGGKQAFGGVIGPAANKQAQDMAIALSEGSPTMRLGHTIYANPLMNGRHPLPPMLSSGGASANSKTAASVVAPPPVLPPVAAPVQAAAAAAQTPTASALAPQSSPFSPEFIQNMMLKAIGQYGTVSSAGAGTTGHAIDFVN